MGVVYLRLNNYAPADPGKIIEGLVQSDIQLRGSLTVVDEFGIRQRKY